MTAFSVNIFIISSSISQQCTKITTSYIKLFYSEDIVALSCSLFGLYLHSVLALSREL